MNRISLALETWDFDLMTTRLQRIQIVLVSRAIPLGPKSRLTKLQFVSLSPKPHHFSTVERFLHARREGLLL